MNRQKIEQISKDIGKDNRVASYRQKLKKKGIFVMTWKKN